MQFRYSNKIEYYDAIISIMSENEEEYDELIDEMLYFCEVSGSG